MPDQQAINNAFDFFTQIENAAARLSWAAGITTYTPTSKLDATNTEPTPGKSNEFQKKRPRLEFIFGIGANGGVLQEAVVQRGNPGWLRAIDRTGMLNASLITKPDIVEHRNYLAMILYKIDTMAKDMSEGGILTTFFIQSMKIAGGGNTYKAEDGNYVTNINIETIFSVNDDALAALNS